MSDKSLDDETLMAFADGELDAAEAARVEAAIARDAEAAAKVAAFARSRASLKTAMDAELDEGVPDYLIAAALGQGTTRVVAPDPAPQSAVVSQDIAATNDASSPVVSFAAKKAAAQEAKAARAGARRMMPVRPMALAASVAALGAALLGYLAGTLTTGPQAPIAEAPAPTGLFAMAPETNAPVADALNTVAAGAETLLGDDRLTVIASFEDEAARLCREFELDRPGDGTLVAVACDDGAAWQTTFAVVAPAADGGYAPASSSDALNAYLTAINAGDPLSAADEAAALEDLAR